MSYDKVHVYTDAELQQGLTDGTILPDKHIVFIEAEHRIWTHGAYYGPSLIQQDNIDNAINPTRFLEPILGIGDITLYSGTYSYVVKDSLAAINTTSVLPEGYECMVDIYNSGSTDLIFPIPNGSDWQCEEPSLIVPPGKVGSISIRYVHGKYCARVGI